MSLPRPRIMAGHPRSAPPARLSAGARSAAMMRSRWRRSVTSTSSSTSMNSASRCCTCRPADGAVLCATVSVRRPARARLRVSTTTRPTRAAAEAVVPVDVEETLRRCGEILERVAIRRVDGHALAGRDDAEDALARQRVAAAGEVEGHAADQPGDRQPGMLPRSARPVRLGRAAAWRRSGRAAGRAAAHRRRAAGCAVPAPPRASPPAARASRRRPRLELLERPAA